VTAPLLDLLHLRPYGLGDVPLGAPDARVAGSLVVGVGLLLGTDHGAVPLVVAQLTHARLSLVARVERLHLGGQRLRARGRGQHVQVADVQVLRVERLLHIQELGHDA